MVNALLPSLYTTIPFLLSRRSVQRTTRSTDPFFPSIEPPSLHITHLLQREKKKERRRKSRSTVVVVVVVVVVDDDPALFTEVPVKLDTSRGIRREARTRAEEEAAAWKGAERAGGLRRRQRRRWFCWSDWPSTSIFKTIRVETRGRGGSGGDGGCRIHSAISGGEVVHRRRRNK